MRWSLVFVIRIPTRVPSQCGAYKTFPQHNRFQGGEQVVEGFRFNDVTVSAGVDCGACHRAIRFLTQEKYFGVGREISNAPRRFDSI